MEGEPQRNDELVSNLQEDPDHDAHVADDEERHPEVQLPRGVVDRGQRLKTAVASGEGGAAAM